MRLIASIAASFFLVLAAPTAQAFDFTTLKGVHTDNVATSTLTGNNVGVVGINIAWYLWEIKQSDCLGSPANARQIFEGTCYLIDAVADRQINTYSSSATVRGLDAAHPQKVRVTAILQGVPDTANAYRRSLRGGSGLRCNTNANDGARVYCAPDDTVAFARFVRFIAQRYKDKIYSFVIHNEVNNNAWFDVACPPDAACDVNGWVKTYADQYNVAYDAIRKLGLSAPVLVSLTSQYQEGRFDIAQSTPGQDPQSRVISVQRFLKIFANLVGTRAWAVAYHPYTSSLTAPVFDADDLRKTGIVEPANIGILSGWLRAQFPKVPSAWQVHLTESGLNTATAADDATQSTQLCQAFRNITGTPGIQQFILNRMIDNVDEHMNLGLFRVDAGRTTPKAAWSTWALSNRLDVPKAAGCGFESAPYIRLVRYSLTGATTTPVHWTSTRQAPAGFKAEAAWYLLRDPASAGTREAFECEVEGTPRSHSLITVAASCEGQQPRGGVGSVFTAARAGLVPLYRCGGTTVNDHFVSEDARCEDPSRYHSEGLLGYAARAPIAPLY